ncbi:MAG TPA: hypothetical protein VGL89_07415, partial [Candidatus Koribacter sp.]
TSAEVAHGQYIALRNAFCHANGTANLNSSPFNLTGEFSRVFQFQNKFLGLCVLAMGRGEWWPGEFHEP